MKARFFKCNVCGQIMTVVKDTNLTVRCCMRDMEELIPNKVDGAEEKHVPVVTQKENTVCVQVGAEKHPMIPEHKIEWIAIATNHGMQLKYLTEKCEPSAEFHLREGEIVEEVYAYCNIHGLWMSMMHKE